MKQVLSLIEENANLKALSMVAVVAAVAIQLRNGGSGSVIDVDSGSINDRRYNSDGDPHWEWLQSAD